MRGDVGNGHVAWDAAVSCGAAGAPVFPGLGYVRVSELFQVLVDSHGLTVMHAVRELGTAMLAAGYPMDVDEVSAADAFDILDCAVHRRS